MGITTKNLEVKKLRPRYRKTLEAEQIVVPLVGRFDALKAQEPAVGAPFAGFPADFEVKEVSIQEGQSVEGRMEVTLEKLSPGNTGSGGSSSSPLPDSIYELDWMEERRPVEEHPKCFFLKSDRPWREYPESRSAGDSYESEAAAGDKKVRQRTWEHWAVLDTDDISESGNPNAWTLEQYKEIKEKGFDDYPVASPVASQTSYHKAKPDCGSGIWTISSPPSYCGAPTGWIYVKVCDRSTKQGRLYTRVQQWRGFANATPLFFL